MAKKFKTSSNRAEIEELQAIENKANGVPCSGSILIRNVWTNVEGTPGTERIRDILESDEGEFAYEIDEESDYENSDKLSAEEKSKWSNAKAGGVNELPHPPEWSHAKEK